jgi:hypothetical protein
MKVSSADVVAMLVVDEVEADRQKDCRIEILERNGAKGVFAREDMTVDSFIKLQGVISDQPTRHSVQLGQGKHLSLPIDCDGVDNPDYFWIYLNHSCQPNGYINVAELTFRLLRKISKGEECTFNYLTTEENMAEPFNCTCGAVKCFGLIRGYEHLSREQQEELAALAASYQISQR